MSHGNFEEHDESVTMLLESMAADGYESSSEMLEDFVARTPMLTEGERADILAEAMEARGRTDWNRTGQNVAQWGQFGADLMNLAGSLAGAFGGQKGRDAQRVLQTAGTVGGALARTTGGAMQMAGRPQQGQVPPIRRQPPGPPPAGQGFAPPGAMPGPAVAGPQVAGPQVAGPQAQPGPAGPVGTDAMALLHQLLSNPQLMQQLGATIVQGSTSPREVVLEIADDEGMSEVAIPLGAVMNAIANLATESMVELNALTREDEPEIPDYLVGQHGEFIVDPSNAEDRAALVVDYFRRAREARRTGPIGTIEDDWEIFQEDAGDDQITEWNDF